MVTTGRIRKLVAGLALVLAAGASVGRAQITASIEAGASRTNDWTGSNYNAGVFNSYAQLIRTYVRVDAYAGYESYSGSSGFSQGQVYAYLYTPAKGLISGEFSLAAGASNYDGTRSGNYITMFRGYMANDSQGIWAGAGPGRRYYTLDSVSRKLVRADIGGWIGRPRWNVMPSLTTTKTGDVCFTDLESKADLFLGTFDLTVLTGYRWGDGVPEGSERNWISITPTYWFTPKFGVSTTAGTYQYDVFQDFPGAKYVNVLFKLRSGVPKR